MQQQKSETMIHIVLVEDHDLTRRQMASLIKSESDMEVVAEAVNGEESITRTSEHKPDVIVMDEATARLMDMLLRADWQAAHEQSGDHWGEALDVSGAWVQWQLEQRLRALPFASTVD